MQPLKAYQFYSYLSRSLLSDFKKSGESFSDQECKSRIEKLLRQFTSLCEINKSPLLEALRISDFEKLKEIVRHVQVISKKENQDPNLSLLATKFDQIAQKLFEESPILLKRQSIQLKREPENIHNTYLPTEILRLIFQRLPDIRTMIQWGAICQRYRRIAHDVTNWKNAKGFQALLKDRSISSDCTLKDAAVQRKVQAFYQMLRVLHDSPLSDNLEQRLAGEFFQRASNRVLRAYLLAADEHQKEFFFDLIEDFPLSRKSLSLKNSEWAFPEEPLSDRPAFPLRSILEKLPALERLDLSFNDLLRDHHLETLARMKSLKSVDLRDCRNITEEAIERLRQQAPTLKIKR